MTLERHVIPTHLGVQDHAFYGLSVRQVMYLTGGCSLAYSLWNAWGDALPELRLSVAIACALLAGIVALVRPGGHGFDEWAVVVLRYLLIARCLVWRPAEPNPDAWAATAQRWIDLAPRPRWQEDAPCER